MKVPILTLCLLIFLFTFSTQTFAVDFTVNTTNDLPDTNAGDGSCLTTAGDCSLRAAVQEANALAANDRVLFNLPANSTITLTAANGSRISITENGTLEIIGTGANNLTINGAQGIVSSIFRTNATATISGVTLMRGEGEGGRGGAIYATGGLLTLDRVHVKENSTNGLEGGGGVEFSDGTHRIINSTFSANTARNCAGVVNDVGSTLTIVNSTISGNHGRGVGGFCNNGYATLRNVTITNNSAVFGGGGISNTGILDFGNTIVAGNTSNISNPEIQFWGGTITSSGGNLVGDSPGDSTNTGNFSITYQPTDIRDVNPMFGILQNNGGTTPIHALFAGSPAIDFGLNALAVDPSNGNTALVFDQRGTGFPRIVDGNSDGTATVDIGAFEVQPTSVNTCTPTTTVTEGDLFPGGLASFGVTSSSGSVTVDHVNAGTGLRTLTVVGTPTNATINIPAFTLGTFNPITVTFTATTSGQAVDFTLRASSQFHAANIRVRCAETCTPSTTVTEGNLALGGIVSFGVLSGAGSVTIDHVNAGTGLQSLTVVGTPTNAVVNIPPFTPGTFNPVVVTFSVIDPTQPVDFTLRAASTFHAANIRVRCGTPPNKPKK